mmetsp:Transcript_12793/g.26878  ORF Transcript_12793/g.26878 Transcript_12793/m.26878 type:complete len:105 (-) Transcript_12793:184-498(-)
MRHFAANSTATFALFRACSKVAMKRDPCRISSIEVEEQRAPDKCGDTNGHRSKGSSCCMATSPQRQSEANPRESKQKLTDDSQLPWVARDLLFHSSERRPLAGN